MARFRFFSDTAERVFLSRFPDRAIDDDNCVELETPDEFVYAQQLGACEEPPSTSGADGFQDIGAVSTRSNSTRIPGYAHEPVFNVFPNRRKTRGQP
jgi:hypothetical protein